MPPHVQVTGVAMECSKENATFEVNVKQYISCLKPGPVQAGGSPMKPFTTFFCHIPDSPKYRTSGSKPLPGNKRFVSVSGLLTGVDRSGDGSEVEQFRIDVDAISFCGHYVQPVDPAASMNPPTCTYV